MLQLFRNVMLLAELTDSIAVSSAIGWEHLVKSLVYTGMTNMITSLSVIIFCLKKTQIYKVTLTAFTKKHRLVM